MQMDCPKCWGSDKACARCGGDGKCPDVQLSPHFKLSELLDSGTAPEPRGLIVWDLRQRRKIFAGTYASPHAIKPGHIEYWLESAAATDRNCPARQQWATLGLGAAVETQVRLRLADAQILRSRRTRCSQRQ